MTMQRPTRIVSCATPRTDRFAIGRITRRGIGVPLLTTAALACSSGRASPPGHEDAKAARPAPSTTTGNPASPSGAQMQITYDVPDEAWRKAGETVMAAWREALAA